MIFRKGFVGAGTGMRGLGWWHRAGAFVVAAVAITVLLPGCPDTDIGTTPPFDTTGNYTGTYSTSDGKQFFGATDCNFDMELVQFVGQPLIAYTFAGIANLGWDCILPAVVRESLGISSDTLIAPVLATLDNDGGFELSVDINGSNIPQALFDLLDTSGIETDIPVESFSLDFTGTGVDADNDGFMDSCSGTLSVMVTYVDSVTTTTEMIDLGGTFEVTRTAAAS
ncbi:MAG: hypothetical protein L3K26_08035 [Candidatus Hydrogenedentes bacterium]|nr:hypothetical protein [Candidatus Hydrogenedentota bacterium]